MESNVIKISSLISSDVRSRSNADIVRNAMMRMSDKAILDFSGVSFVSRSFSDELCSVVEHFHNLTIVMINMSDVVRNMIEIVKNGRKNKRVRINDESVIKEFDNIDSLLKFLNSEA
ncbi:hypothetical protein [Odoribacter lunatus]|uniref:hypothetical protein n=1 Tax=Odoribacter lunatus TaxID=2941335 RepID=UPI00203B990A|nr:hypothetical protein [Odoribacter lunatus]